MTSKDKKHFAELMMALGEAFDKIPSSAKMEIYFRALEDMTIEEVSQACSDLIKTRTITGTFPLVAEIREVSIDKIEDLALAAWSKLSWAMDYVGSGGSIAFDDQNIMKAIVIWAGSWRKIYEMDWNYDHEKWRKKEFLECYKAATRGNITCPEYFPGDYEHHNEEKGFIDYLPCVQYVYGNPGSFAKTIGKTPKTLPTMNQQKELTHEN